MIAPDSFARDRILAAAAALLRTPRDEELKLDEIARGADTDLETIAYFFDTSVQLKAEAQMLNYFEMIEPHHVVLARVEAAIAGRDRESFWSSIEENMVLAWSSGRVGEKWGLIQLLQDVWKDPFSQSHFRELLDIQFQRWIDVIADAQELGWIDREIDAKSMIAIFWSASVGQVITADSSVLDLSPQASRDFLMRIVRGSRTEDSAVL